MSGLVSRGPVSADLCRQSEPVPPYQPTRLLSLTRCHVPSRIQGLPHNPLINAGAIMVASLIDPQVSSCGLARVGLGRTRTCRRFGRGAHPPLSNLT